MRQGAHRACPESGLRPPGLHPPGPRSQPGGLQHVGATGAG
ncbi:hypothetical protein CSB93_4465 [Pseudomonas paraeruginosa]|uniref:Uncharacterized protein n=1 Tax=Pseudomonas paraeruginosa TaxID=2994495 RepID=A0A2R3J4C4_9PSED|nr:hypothetical protein CSB93_4465 [Pseudomonas paraeruginosa]AWE92351.1 hypothetical protein CSC28_3255 [Pseudomonas paraeruginosa]